MTALFKTAETMEAAAPGASAGVGPADETPALAVAGVSHAFGAVQALSDVSLTVPPGAMVVLLGLNGAGKSTLFSLITRLYDNVSGSIRILGYDVRRTPSAALQRLGVVFQSRTLDTDLTLTQNLIYHANLHGFAGRQARTCAVAALAAVGLTDKANVKVRTLSGGQSRRVEIARALMHGPRLLLLDEATVGLDIGSRESVLKIVRGLAKAEGLGVLWATHLIDEVTPGDLVVLLHRGRMIFSGTVPGMLECAGAGTLSDAFRALTGSAAVTSKETAP